MSPKLTKKVAEVLLNNYDAKRNEVFFIRMKDKNPYFSSKKCVPLRPNFV